MFLCIFISVISLILNLEKHRQLSHIQHGMRITVHNKDVFPFPFEDGLTVAAGDEIFIGIRKVMVIIYQLTYIFLSWNCVLLSTNKGGQINFGVI